MPADRGRRHSFCFRSTSTNEAGDHMAKAKRLPQQGQTILTDSSTSRSDVRTLTAPRTNTAAPSAQRPRGRFPSPSPSTGPRAAARPWTPRRRTPRRHRTRPCRWSFRWRSWPVGRVQHDAVERRVDQDAAPRSTRPALSATWPMPVVCRMPGCSRPGRRPQSTGPQRASGRRRLADPRRPGRDDRSPPAGRATQRRAAPIPRRASHRFGAVSARPA